MQPLRRDERGSVAVEAALILPILILVLFGIIEFSIALTNKATLASAARSGARTASALPRDPTFAANAAEAVAKVGMSMPLAEIQDVWVYEAGNNGFPVGQNGFNSCASRCILYRPNGTGGFRQAGGSWSYTLVNACPTDVARMTTVGVLVRAKHTFATGLIGQSGITLGDHTTMRFEPIPSSRISISGGCS